MKPNAELAWRVLDHIDAHPANWRQGIWIGQAECGTVACFAGWTVLLSDLPVRDEFAWLEDENEERHIAEVAEELLGIDELGPSAPDVFDGLLTRAELGERVAEIFGPRPAPTAAAPGPYGIAGYRQPLTDFERRAGVIEPGGAR